AGAHHHGGRQVNWILLIFIHASVLSKADDVSITTARFYNQNACQAAGQEVAKLTRLTVQEAKFVCIHDAEDGK
ncbi:hypothetical protein, partial [Burkholderia gladioli]|uniref:hypothetical protein n=1 Tax=Burkholderia gladioli TaxID=28095 RepID=UPI001ABBCD74